MAEQPQEHHVLLIEVQGQVRSMRLEGAVYTLGRHVSNAIVLNEHTVSRAHALLIRCPAADKTGYRYKLLDGNSSGHPSSNGTFINNQQCSQHTLSHGDVLRFGETVKASYFRVYMTLKALAELFPLKTVLSANHEGRDRLDFTQTMGFEEDLTILLPSAEMELDGDITAVSCKPMRF